MHQLNIQDDFAAFYNVAIAFRVQCYYHISSFDVFFFLFLNCNMLLIYADERECSAYEIYGVKLNELTRMCLLNNISSISYMCISIGIFSVVFLHEIIQNQ